jgi:hypothetical protein
VVRINVLEGLVDSLIVELDSRCPKIVEVDDTVPVRVERVNLSLVRSGGEKLVVARRVWTTIKPEAAAGQYHVISSGG